MTEDELLTGLLDAFALAGWSVYHVRRSDRAIVQGAGSLGWPDIFAVSATRREAVALELKTASGRLTTDQLRWILELRSAGIWADVVRPADYDRILTYIVGLEPWRRADAE